MEVLGKYKPVNVCKNNIFLGFSISAEDERSGWLPARTSVYPRISAIRTSNQKCCHENLFSYSADQSGGATESSASTVAVVRLLSIKIK